MTDEGTGFGLRLLCAGRFRRLRAATYFARGGKVGKTPPGTAPEEHRSGAPSRLSPDPITGVIPWGRQRISGAQNLSECLNPRRATGPWVCEKLGPARFHNRACLCRANAPGPVLAVGAALAAAFSLPLGEGAPVLTLGWMRGTLLVMRAVRLNRRGGTPGPPRLLQDR